MSAPSAGWYADASDPGLVRWWDGVAWSEHTQPSPPAAPAAEAAQVSPAPVFQPPFADAQPSASPQQIAPLPPLDYPPPSLSSPELVSPSAPVAARPRRAASSSLPISEPVRLVFPTAGAAPVAGFPGFDDALPAPSSEPTTASGSFAVSPLATATHKPASASTPWAAATNFAQPTASVDLASVDYEPMTRTWSTGRSASQGRTVTGVTTAGAWMLALSPWVALGLATLGWLLTESGTSSVAPIVGGALGLVLLLWIVVGAITDYRRLGALGHEFRPSVAWIVAGPFFYLMARAIHVYRTTRSGTGPTWVYVVSVIVVSAVVSAGSLLFPRDAGLTELRAVESTIVNGLQQDGFDYSVLCPSEAPAALGSSFICTAYDEVGPAALIRVTWTGLGGGFDYELESTAATTR